jgi:tetratricopeptide (TPR) repeat protein
MTMKKRFAFTPLAWAALAASAFAQQSPAPTPAAPPPPAVRLPQVSQGASVKQTIGLNDVTITYSRPGVKGRKIWGGLVPYGSVWRTGANAATSIQFTEDVLVESQPLPAGTYSLHTIPGETEWTIIFNKEASQWGSYSYEAAKDALRIKVTPVPGAPQEWMQFRFEDPSINSARVVLAWENLQIPFTIRNATDTNTKVVAMLRESVAKAKADEWQPYYRAGNYLVQNKISMDDAGAWLDKAIAISPTPQTHYAKARYFDAAGKPKEAIAELDKALAAAKPDTPSALVDEIRNVKKTWSDKKT